MIDLLSKNWSIIIYTFGIIGVYIADHFKIKSLESKLEHSDRQYISLSKQIKDINDNLIRLQTIIEERFRQ